MASWLSQLFKSGTHEYRHLTADSEKELQEMARRLRVEVHGKGQQVPHLDINERKSKLALRYGARPENRE